MILKSVENGPLIWPSIEENRVTRPKKYSELSATKAIQADCDVIGSRIAESDDNSQERHHIDIVKLVVENESFGMNADELDKETGSSNGLQPKQADLSCVHTLNEPHLHKTHVVPSTHKADQCDDPIDAINHMMSFLTIVVTFRYPTTNNLLRNSSNPRQQATVNDGRINLQPVQGRQISFASGHMSKQCTKCKRKRDDSWFKDKVLLVQAQVNGQILHEKELAFLADPGIAEVFLMANLSHYSSDALAEVHNPDNVDTNMINQDVQAMSSSEQLNVVNHSETEITNALILSMIEQLKTQVVNYTKINLDNKSVNDTLTAELERYKEQVKVLKECQNVALKSNDNVSDSCAQSVKIDQIKQTLSEHLKKESLMQTVTLLKNDFKKEEFRNIDREIALEKRIKQLDNIVFKRDQSAQTVYMLTKPLFFYDHTTKQALVIKKLKERIKSLSGNIKEDKIKKHLKEIETINIELDHRVSKLIAENEHLKQTYKQLYDSIKSTRIRSKEQCDDLINQVNLNSVEISDLNATLQEKVLVIIALKNDLRNLKRKALADDVVTSHSIAPGMLKVDVEPLAPKLLNNRTVHSDYLRHTQEQAAILKENKRMEAMINCIKHDDQPLPRVTQVSIVGISSTEQPHLKDKSMWSDQEKKIQKIDRLERSLLIQGLLNDIYSLIDSNKTAKDL
uniref:Integrase, catalytic region, zinc finger, CCHC-type, peptidase aspartic, catalytic n=1 Tax=Tanacetum cinerariifolium TaxID=118510 RepID=A0A6L2NY88_TANCI|nr:hypothetical protein [Tanacetum cinerariifolium]